MCGSCKVCGLFLWLSDGGDLCVCGKKVGCGKCGDFEEFDGFDE